MLVAWLHFGLGLGAWAAAIALWNRKSLNSVVRVGVTFLLFVAGAIGLYFGAELLRAYYAGEQTGWGMFDGIPETQFNYLFATIAFAVTGVAVWMLGRDISVRLSEGPNPSVSNLVTDLTLALLGAWFLFDYVGRILGVAPN